MDRLVWYLFAGSRGGPTRVRIARALFERPRNANELARLLGLDYKTVEYNLRVLSKHVLVVRPAAGSYGAAYEPSKNLRALRGDFERVAAALPAEGPPPATPSPGDADMGKEPNTPTPRGEPR